MSNDDLKKKTHHLEVVNQMYIECLAFGYDDLANDIKDEIRLYKEEIEKLQRHGR